MGADNRKKIGIYKVKWLRISYFRLIFRGIFFLFFTFRMAGYLDFNAPNAPRHDLQHTVGHFGLL